MYRVIRARQDFGKLAGIASIAAFAAVPGLAIIVGAPTAKGKGAAELCPTNGAALRHVPYRLLHGIAGCQPMRSAGQGRPELSHVVDSMTDKVFGAVVFIMKAGEPDREV